MMHGKICMVTGGTAGIGQEVARALAGMGAAVVLTGRNRQKAEASTERIVEETGNPDVSFLLADFASLDEVRQLAADFGKHHKRLDVLVNNAGSFFSRRILTSQGVEMTLAVNHLGAFLLTNLLLDQLGASPAARIVVVSSAAHVYGKLDPNDLGAGIMYQSFPAYARSKLATVLFTYELARRLSGTAITVNAVHPGHVATDIWANSIPVAGGAVKWVMDRVAISVEQGADTVIYLATSPEVEGVTGQYFENRKPVPSSALSYDESLASQLWDASARLVGLDQVQN